MREILKNAVFGIPFAIVLAAGLGVITGFQTPGYSSRLFMQVPNDGLSGIRGAEVLGYGYLFNGTTWDRTRVGTKLTAVSLGAGTAETTILTPTSGKRFRWTKALLTAGAGTLWTFKDNTAGTTIFTITVGTNTPISIDLGNGFESGAINRVLTITRGTSGTLDGYLLTQEY